MAGRQAKRDESVRSGSWVGGLRGPSRNAPPFYPPNYSPLCGRKSLQGTLRGMWTARTGLPAGLCDLGGQLGLSVPITCLQGAWAKVCINMLVPACLPLPHLAYPPPAWLLSEVPIGTGALMGSGGQGGLRSDLHPSISGTWEEVGAGATIRSG